MGDSYWRRRATRLPALVCALMMGYTAPWSAAQSLDLEPQAAVNAAPARYVLQPGLELLFTASMDLTISGPYSEQSNRVFESRFVVMNETASGDWDVMGVSKLAKRIMDGEELPDPFGTPEAYLFQMDDYGGFHGYQGEEPQFGTAWTPMIHLPPLPSGGVPTDSRGTRGCHYHRRGRGISRACTPSGGCRPVIRSFSMGR